jgi:hypothetical protein
MQLEEKDLARFWAKIQVAGDDECWLWTGAKHRKGYGRFKVRGKLLLPHRIAYSLSNQDELIDLFICHRCDNPPCCNPNHLFLGTRSDNMKDCHRKGRLTMPLYRGGGKKGPKNQKGERSNSSKLKNEDVFKIRELSAQGQNSVVLSEIFGVTPRNRLIVQRKTWKHI